MEDREANIKKLKQECFELLIIGGGATGAGVSLDAAERGISTALIEKKDFASGTSSKSTKLIHGGVRYLREALTGRDVSQFALVREALKERHILLNIAPHLVSILPIVIPVRSWGECAYYFLGMKIYEWLSGKFRIGNSIFISRQKLIHAFPGICCKNFKGGIQFFDCQFDDARMNLAIILTAKEKGAVISNYLEAISLARCSDDISSVQVLDRLSGEVFAIRSKILINAAGPLSDHVRALDQQAPSSRLLGSQGTHLVLSGKHTPLKTGLLIPNTADNRVFFLLPWKESSLVGTTDIPYKLTEAPVPSDDEIRYLLSHLAEELGVSVTGMEIKSCWSGIRPLVSSETIETAQVSRGYKIIKERSGFYSIIGGKWTSYRKMAEVLLDQICKEKKMDKTKPCKTEKSLLIGASGYSKELSDRLIDKYGLERDIALHLSDSYGIKADDVIRMAKKEHSGLDRLAEGYPYIMGEILYAIRCEMACTVQDVLLRRTRLGALDSRAALKALPKVSEEMQREIGWDANTLKDQMESAERELACPVHGGE